MSCELNLKLKHNNLVSDGAAFGENRGLVRAPRQVEVPHPVCGASGRSGMLAGSTKA